MKPAGVHDGDLVKLAIFMVGGEEYAIDIMRIKEIINPLKITPVPKVPGFIEGVIELRGAIIPIVDLRKRFDLPATTPTRSTKYIIVSIEGKIVGLIVDVVTKVHPLPRGDLRPTPTLMMGEADSDAARYFTSVFYHDGRIVMALDIDKILTSHEKISLAGLTGPGGARGAAK